MNHRLRRVTPHPLHTPRPETFLSLHNQLSVVVAKQDDRFSSTDTRQQWLAVPAVDVSYFLHGRSRVSSLLPQHKRAERTYVADAVYLANR